MRTKLTLICVILALMPFVRGYAQDYTGYNYVANFNTGSSLNGSISGTYLSTADEYLRFNIAGQSGARNSTFTLSPTTSFTKKLIVEFDWYATNYTGGSGDEGQVQFRSSGSNVLFTLYGLVGSNNQIGIAAGALNGGKAATVDARYRTSLTNTPAAAWYHVKAEIYAGQRIAFTVTGANDYIRKAMLPVPSGFSLTSINSLYFNATRNGSNITWDARIDNIGIRVADADADISASSVNITSVYDVISLAGSTALTAEVLPFDASSHAIIWSVDNTLATITAGYPTWTATLNGANSGTGTVTVTATSATAGVIATKQINIVQSVLLSNITISGSASVAVNATAALTASVLPGNASNKNVVWTSLNPEIATVSASGVVTGVSAGTATISASAADGGGAQATHQINVTFTSVTSIDLQGARRIFYTPNPASIAAFTLTSTVLPADASLKTLAWTSTNEAIATVTSAGSVKLAGGFGKCAIKASATDGSNVERCYYIEVAATNPYDVFSDFETNAQPFTGSRSSFQSTQTIYFNGSGNGNRGTTWQLTSAVQGGKINLHFDWWAGLVTTNGNTGVLSIQDANTDANMILSIIFCNSSTLSHFRYLAGNYTPSGDEPPQGIDLENITALDRWYVLDVTIDFLANECSFTITDRDNPAITQTVENIPLSPVYPPQPRVASLYINGLRAATQGLNITSAIDNFAYKVLDASLPTYEVTGLSLKGLDNVAPNGKILVYPKIAPGNALNKNVTFQSSNPDIATVTVDTYGRALVTGISNGTVTITATSVQKPEITAQKTITVAPVTLPQRQMERLDRGLVAVKVTNGVFLSWRLLGTDPADVTFNLYKNGGATPVNSAPLAPAYTDFTDAAGTLQDTYQLAVLVGGNEIYRSAASSVWANQYKSIPVEKPTTGHLPTGEPYSNYTIYDGSAADLDGDGQYEIVFLWVPANLQDNSNGGQTGNVFIDAYKLDGTKLWGAGKYIDLGSNIRAGAHYSPFLVYDFDGDGKAEIIIRTADGTTDTQGNMVGENVVYANADGFVLNGPEFVSVFEGATGKLLDSAPYEPERGRVQDWGDGIGNRADRFLAAVAHLDGVKASAVMTRGYYTRTTLCAWDWDGKKLAKRWMFDTNVAGGQYKGQGNHNMSVADVDDDGKDEIIYGSLTIDDDGTAMYTTGLMHGDAMHVGKLDPTRPGLQMMGVHEGPFPYGMEMHDLLTGDVIWGVVASGDIGRGLTADIDPLYAGEESWSSGGLGTMSAQGTRLAGSLNSVNMAIWWDGNTGRELFDGSSNPSVTRITASGTAPSRSYSSSSIMTFSGASTNGGTKNNPCLQADILGDWREEMILRSSDNSELRIYTTVAPTEHTGAGAVPESGIPTLMHNKTYRLAAAWQNAGYNQPPHADVFIGYNMENVPRVANAAITITLDANGGTFADNTALKQITSIYGAYFDLPAVTKSSSTFVGWYFADGTEYNPNAYYTENITLIAAWTFTVTLNVNGGEVSVEIGNKLNVSQHFAIGAIPEPVRSCYEFKEWNLKEDGTGETVTAETIFDFNADITLYAQWIPVCPLEALSVTPADGATDVSVYALPGVKLSDRVNLYGEPNLLRVKISGAMGVSASYSDSTITVAHSAEFAANTAYTVTVPKTAVKNLAEDVVWTFRTGNAPIEVVAATPAGEGVMRDEVISITFSKNPYINAEPKWNLITVHNDNTNRNVEGLFVSGAGLSGNTYTVFHDLLDKNTDYTVTVPANAVAGLAAPVIWTFKTGAEFINSANGLQAAEAGISVYPTLTDGIVQINTANEAEIRLCDIAGKILEIRSSAGGACEFNLAERASGVYFVVIATAEKTSVTKVTKK